MCLILFAHRFDPRYRLVLAANRDEFHARPTLPAHFWGGDRDILAGRDLESGGTWLGVTRQGRWAAVTNFREMPEPSTKKAVSRGLLVSGFLKSSSSPAAYAEELLPHGADYSGYNLLVGDPDEVAWCSNRTEGEGEKPLRVLEPGIYGLSNHLLDTPWPKVVRGKALLRETLESHSVQAADSNLDSHLGRNDNSDLAASLLEVLLDRTYAADHQLPSTGVTPELERALSASFIKLADYGTRSSSALLIGTSGEIHFAERRFDASGQLLGEDQFDL
jgi:uncharacterized protein with NRDE domain